MHEPIEEALFSKWLAVYNAADTGEDCRKLVSQFNSLYKKANVQQQGEYHLKVHTFIKSRED